MASHYRLERTGAVDLEFEGRVIANVTSRLDESAPRWTEIVVYRTTGGKYVVEVIGMSTYRGEKERRDVKIADSPEGLVEALHRQGSNGPYLTRTALDALDAAAENDPRVKPVITERL